MRQVRPLAILGLLTLALAACIETKQDVYVNPDGSGKVTFDMNTAPPISFGSGGESLPDSNTLARKAVGEILEKSKGVEAWSDVSYKILPTGRIQLHATAYFKNINDLKIDPTPAFNWDSTKQSLTLAPPPKTTQPGEAEKPATKPAQPVDNLAARMQYQQGRPMIMAMLSNMKINLTYHLPGAVDNSAVMTRSAPDAVTLDFEGDKLLAGMDKLMTDDKFLAEQGSNKITFDKDPSLAVLATYGTRQLPTAHVAGTLKPNFDYAAEVSKAKAAEAEMFKKLNINH